MRPLYLTALALSVGLFLGYYLGRADQFANDQLIIRAAHVLCGQAVHKT